MGMTLLGFYILATSTALSRPVLTSDRAAALGDQAASTMA